MGDMQDSPTFFPTLLSPEELKKIVIEKYQNIPNLRRLSEADFLKIYNNMMVPLPQRQYSANLRGRRLKERRMKRGLQAKEATIKTLTSANISSQGSVRQTTSEDRLKPPPSIAASKIIKLSKPPLLSPNSTKLRRESSDSEQERKSSKRNDLPGDPPNDGGETGKKRKIEKITWP